MFYAKIQLLIIFNDFIKPTNFILVVVNFAIQDRITSSHSLIEHKKVHRLGILLPHSCLQYHFEWYTDKINPKVKKGKHRTWS